MTVGDLIRQLGLFLANGAVTAETPVLADGCDCEGPALAAVVVQRRSDTIQFAETEGETQIAFLLVSREDSGHDLRPAPEKPDPLERKFTITEGRGCTSPPVDKSPGTDEEPTS